MNKPAFEQKASLFTLSVLFLQTHKINEIKTLLQERSEQLPNFFDEMPVIIDLLKLTEQAEYLDLDQLKSLLLEFRLIPVALKHVPDALIASAKSLNWGILKDHKSPHKSNINAEQHDIISNEINSEHHSDNSAPLKAEAQKPTIKSDKNLRESRVILHPIRSGQQIYAQGDVTLLNTVSAGAEVLADGNIHSYGILRGRILAGVKGDKEARIFCQKLEAEWISIAGIYKVIEDLDLSVKGKAVQIYLQDEQLKIELLA